MVPAFLRFHAPRSRDASKFGDTTTANRRTCPVTDVMERVTTHQQFIDGQWVDAAGGKTLAVENPAHGQVIAHVQASGAEDVDRAANPAAKAFETWQWPPPHVTLPHAD
jgi:delta 1-pyrroline-5-carboxylate dehydrogenase